jgi:hypothetical protein
MLFFVLMVAVCYMFFLQVQQLAVKLQLAGSNFAPPAGHTYLASTACEDGFSVGLAAGECGRAPAP